MNHIRNKKGIPRESEIHAVGMTYPVGEYQYDAFRNRENIGALMSPEQIEKAERLVRSWKPKSN